jgi:hypothetical protein
MNCAFLRKLIPIPFPVTRSRGPVRSRNAAGVAVTFVQYNCALGRTLCFLSETKV